jgi:hypothetical protein
MRSEIRETVLIVQLRRVRSCRGVVRIIRFAPQPVFIIGAHSAWAGSAPEQASARSAEQDDRHGTRAAPDAANDKSGSFRAADSRSPRAFASDAYQFSNPFFE